MKVLARVLPLAAMMWSLVMAGYKIDVTKLPGATDGIETIAISPAVCSADVNCVWVEQKLFEDLAAYRQFRVVSASAVRQAMLELAIEKIDDQARIRLAEKLTADAFLIPIVRHGGKESEGAVGFWPGNMFYMGSDEVSKGSVELVLMKADTGKTIVKGVGFGESEWYGQKGVIAKTFRKILAEAFGPGD